MNIKTIAIAAQKKDWVLYYQDSPLFPLDTYKKVEFAEDYDSECDLNLASHEIDGFTFTLTTDTEEFFIREEKKDRHEDENREFLLGTGRYPDDSLERLQLIKECDSFSLNWPI